MGTNAKQVRGDERSGELAARNEKEIMPIPDEITEWSEQNKIYIFNVSPYPHIVQHPSLGKVTIHACEPGKKYSKPTVLKGMVPYGVCVEMKSVEMRHESGRFVAVDLLGIGPFMNAKNSLLRQGVFIAAANTFDPTKTTDVRVAAGRNGQPITMALPEWVKKGKCAENPTEEEIQKAQELFAEFDFALIAEGDEYSNQGPNALVNITKMHREALQRRGLSRTWAAPNQTLVDCPGCGDKVKPGIRKHVACGWRFDLNGFEAEHLAKRA